MSEETRTSPFESIRGNLLLYGIEEIDYRTVYEAVLDDLREIEGVLREIAVEVILADDLTEEVQRQALWRTIRHHSAIARATFEDDVT